MNERKTAGREVCNPKLGVVTPGCRDKGNSTWSAFHYPAFTGGCINNKIRNAFKFWTVGTLADRIPLFEMSLLPDPAYAITGSW
jgi:hypothetical protein